MDDRQALCHLQHSHRKRVLALSGHWSVLDERDWLQEQSRNAGRFSVKCKFSFKRTGKGGADIAKARVSFAHLCRQLSIHGRSHQISDGGLLRGRSDH